MMNNEEVVEEPMDEDEDIFDEKVIFDGGLDVIDELPEE